MQLQFIAAQHMPITFALSTLSLTRGVAWTDIAGPPAKKKKKKKPAKTPGGIRIIDQDSTGFRDVKAEPEPEVEEEEGEL